MHSHKKDRSYPGRLGKWLKSHTKIHIGFLLLCIGVLVAVQVLYPHDRALPMARLAGQSVGGTTYDELVRQVTTKFGSSTITLKTDSSTVTLPVSHTGATPDTEEMARSLIDYPMWQRLIPFSLFLRQPKRDSLDVYFNAHELEAVSDEIAKKLTVAPENARLSITGGKLIATAAKVGQTVQAGTVADVLAKQHLIFIATTVAIPSQKKPPTLQDSDIAPIKDEAEAAINRGITIVAPDGKQFAPDSATIASWLLIDTKPDGNLELKIDQAPVSAYVVGLNNQLKVDAGVSYVEMLDGIEVARSGASSGLVIASSELTGSIEQAVLDATAPRRLSARLVPVPPGTTFSRSYSSSQKGLQAYVDYVTQSEDIRIAMAQVGGNGWSASGRAGEQLPAASTYKLYVSYMLFNQINASKLAWGESMLSTDVSGCFERMIIVSDNACAEKFIAMFGASSINNFLYGNGISKATTFVSSTATQTSAADLEKLLLGIEKGSMISGSDRSTILDKMGRQVYRAGVPAGSAGTVQDKVGFLWDYLHDAAIVRHSKGTYVLAIMTKGSSWGRIAEITRQLEHIMYP